MGLSEVEKYLVQGLKSMGAHFDEVLYIMVALYEQEAQLDMLEWMVDHKGASQAERLGIVKEISARYEKVQEKDVKQELADAFADASDRFWDFEDNVYDYEEDTPEYEAACAETDRLRTIMEGYENKILDILAAEGVEIPERGRIEVLAPFMERYGYVDVGGWWVRKDRLNEEV